MALEELTQDQQLRLKAARDYAGLLTVQFKRKPQSNNSQSLPEDQPVIPSTIPDAPSSSTSQSRNQSPSAPPPPPVSQTTNNDQIVNQDKHRDRDRDRKPDQSVDHRVDNNHTHPIRSPRSPRDRPPSRSRSRSPRSRSRYYRRGRGLNTYSPSLSPPRGRGYSRSPLRRGRSRYDSRSPPPIRPSRNHYSRSPPPRRSGYSRSRSPLPHRRRGYSRSRSRSPPSPLPPPRSRYPPVDRKPAALITPVINRTINRIYVGNIAPTLSEQAVRAAFSRFGYIKELSMTRDTDLNTHKGWCFIEYDAPEAAMGAIQFMNATELDSRALKVNHTNAYNDAIWRHFPVKIPTRLYFANVHPLLTEEYTRALFEPFGKLTHFSLCPDVLTFRHKGYGFAEYETEEELNLATKYLNRLGYENNPEEVLLVTPTLVGGPFPEGMAALSRFPRPRIPPPPLPSGPKPTLPRLKPEPPSAVLLLKNMVAPSDVDEYLKEDVEEECNKYGKVKHVVVHVNSSMANGLDESGVRVFVVFESPTDRSAAEKVMHGRFFGGRVVSATEFSLTKFEALDYDS